MNSQPPTFHGSIVAQASTGDHDSRLDELLVELIGVDMVSVDSPRSRKLASQLSAQLELQTIGMQQNRFSPSASANVFHSLVAHPDLNWKDFAGKTFLDVGCGGLNPFSNCMVATCLGVTKALSLIHI